MPYKRLSMKTVADTSSSSLSLHDLLLACREAAMAYYPKILNVGLDHYNVIKFTPEPYQVARDQQAESYQHTDWTA